MAAGNRQTSKRKSETAAAEAARGTRASESPWFEIRPSNIHGLGAFASRTIPAGTRIVEYLGEIISKEESRRRLQAQNHFIFDLDETHDLDGNVEWNPARFINHSCSPNCEAQNIEGRIWIVATRKIPPGEELTFNYGYDIKDYQDYPCRCGSPNCVGYIVAEEYFEEVRRRESRRARPPDEERPSEPFQRRP
ncbi:MAG: SET domain-containing protein-lysine N-methyltransferase [Verrucomicrobia bacterium]|nr:SET domain-containing protein-lysine N-methyltransferase [Verrucomicrobiota bacterium]